ncbi:hypothetical protein CERSUDRAFT_88909 [Gelatoporia subvermispora B]|uniref:Uncharacterized protein n=1 Tax=Ceriporiopsis subvermispora (strain B) TaxID=914234 RepID=M2QYE9_CERS8|nr:hypothetical protein CERSUDRAFT_88909 [Gelatoporia subvermispora B]
MAPPRRRVSYVIPPPTDPAPRLQLPPQGLPRNGAIGPLLVPSHQPVPSPATSPTRWGQHPRHRLGVVSLALDTSTQLVGRATPEGILYTGGRDGLVNSWDLRIPMKQRAQRYGMSGRSARHWEIMTNWADDVIEEEADEGEEFRSDGDVLGEVVGKTRRRIPRAEDQIPSEEQWETDGDALDAFKSSPSTQFRQSAQVHSDWVNDILLCNHNQTLVSASSDGTVRAWSPHAPVPEEPVTVGMHADYVRCLSHCRDQGWIATGSFDRTIKLWDLNTAGSNPVTGSAPLMTLSTPDVSGPKSSIYALATDPYGSVVVSGTPERVIRMWDPRSGKRIGKLVGHTDNIRAILISEDAKYILTGSADASVKLWSLSSQRCLHTFTYHTESVWSLYSAHPSLEIFYSGDRSGLVCRVDVEGCADVSEGECAVLCQDTDERGVSEGINKIVAADDTFVWTASGSSSVKRWKVPPRRAVRAATLSTSGEGLDSPVVSPMSGEFSRDTYGPRSKRNSLDLSRTRARSPLRQGPGFLPYDPAAPMQRSTSPVHLPRAPKSSMSPSVSPSLKSADPSPPEADPDYEREGEDTWYGIPFESLVRLTSPHEPFTGFGMAGSLLRGRDPEIATLYSAASVMSVPRMTRPPMLSVLQPQSSTQQPPRSASPFHSETVYSQTRLGEETQTLHPAARARAAFEDREVAADAVPLRRAPDEVVQGEHGLVRCAMLNDRVHALTVNTAGEVAVWDIIRGVCRGRYPSEDVAAASVGGSVSSIASECEKATILERSPREALETVRERIEGEAVVQSWATVDTKTGQLTVHLNERCFEAEIYADEAGYEYDRRYGDEIRLNIGKWVLKNLFSGFVREEQRKATKRAREAAHETNQHRLQRSSAPTHIEINGHSSDARGRSSSDASSRSSQSAQRSMSATVITSPNMTPAISPAVSSAPRVSPLMTPFIPLGSGMRDSLLSPIPQSPPTNDSTPMPRRSATTDGTATAGPSSAPPPASSDYFSLRGRRGSLSTSAGMTTPDDFSGWGGKSEPAGSQTPSTPGGFMGRFRVFGGKNTRRQASEISTTTPGGTLSGGETVATPGDMTVNHAERTPTQKLLAGPLNPPSISEAPPLSIPPNTSLMISEESLAGWTTLYRGNVSSISGDVQALEEVMPMWLLECLLLNKVPPVPVNKISFVLLPYKDPNGEHLPELLNTAQSKLTASRFLRVRKLTYHVQDKLERIAGSHTSTPNTPRTSSDSRSLSSGAKSRESESRPRAEDMYEILCNDTVLPLDMTLAAVRQFIWRQAGELSMYYRRKNPASPGSQTQQ